VLSCAVDSVTDSSIADAGSAFGDTGAELRLSLLRR